jgi:hypothetical protein
MTTAKITIPANHPNIFALPLFSSIPATEETAKRDAKMRGYTRKEKAGITAGAVACGAQTSGG